MKYYKYIVIFLSILVLLLGGYIIYMKSTISLLNNDINISKYDWDPIGINSNCSYRATFDGNNKIITGLDISQRTIYRDIDTLCDAGIPIYTIKEYKFSISSLYINIFFPVSSYLNTKSSLKSSNFLSSLAPLFGTPETVI